MSDQQTKPIKQHEREQIETAKTDAPVLCLDHKDPEFSPLDHSQLNDYRRRIVAGEEIPDCELKHSIQTFLYHERERMLKETKKPAKKKATTKAKPLPGDFSFDDLLNTEV